MTRIKSVTRRLFGAGGRPLRRKDASLSYTPSADSETARVVQDLRALVRRTPVRDEFVSELEVRLFEPLQTSATATRHDAGMAVNEVRPLHRQSKFRIKHFRPGLAAALVVALSLGAAWPVLGQTVLEHFVPREVAAPEGFPLQPPQALSPPSAMNLDQLRRAAKQAGFILLVPQQVPDKCDRDEYYFDNRHKYARLIYSSSNATCLSISEEPARGVLHAPVAEGSTEEVSVGGRPAIYINGVWLVPEGAAKPIWSPIATHLVFERDGLLVSLTTMTGLTKQQLIAAAESLQ